jgi:hypothetical protein
MLDGDGGTLLALFVTLGLAEPPPTVVGVATEEGVETEKGGLIL